MDASIPYCGLPPSPGAVTWNLDPVLITVLVAGGFSTVPRLPVWARQVQHALRSASSCPAG